MPHDGTKRESATEKLCGSGIAVRVGRAIAAFEPHLVRAVRGGPLHKEFWIESDAAVWVGIELHHPALDAIRIELRINGAVERVGEVYALAVAADLDHLRPAAQRALPGAGMRRLRHDTANAHLAGELGIERVGHVVLLQIAG